MNLAVSASDDGANWGQGYIVTNGFSDHGLQFVTFRGEVWGLMVENNPYKNYLFLTRFSLPSNTWTYFTTVSETARAAGRASVATLDDYFYCCWRGLDDGVYLRWTDKIVQGGKWNEVRVGSEYAKTKAAPAIYAFDGKLYIVGVGDDNAVWFTVVGKDGKKLASWTKIDGTKTQSALALAVYSGKLYLLFTDYNNVQFWYYTLDPSSGGSISGPSDGDTGGERPKIPLPFSNSWTKINAVPSPGIASGPAATTWNGTRDLLFVAYKGNNNNAKYRYFDESTSAWSAEYTVPGLQMMSQVGITTWGGKLIISMGLKPGTFSAPTAVTDGSRLQPQSLDRMNEKGGMAIEESEEEWDCKWKQPEEDKSLLKKWFCM